MVTGCRALTGLDKIEKREEFWWPTGRNRHLPATIEIRTARETPPPLALCGQKKTQSMSGLRCSGGAEGDRTLDLRIANATLSHLSYRPVQTRPDIIQFPRPPG